MEPGSPSLQKSGTKLEKGGDSNFSLNLGEGKITDKRDKLEKYIEKLTSNKKLESEHRRYCSYIKRKRTGNLPSQQLTNAIMDK